MAERPDLRKIAGDIRVALDTYPREALVDILTYVFQTYVVEGAPTLHAAQPERLTELEGLPFPDLMQALQARLDVPELALFDVQGGRVTLRAGGEAIPVSLSPADRRASAAPLGPAAPAPAPEETAGRPAQAAQAEAPRARGVSIASNPGSAANPSARQAPSAPAPAPRPTPAAPARPAAAPAQAGGQRQAASDADPGDDDAASRRFKLLEID